MEKRAVFTVILFCICLLVALVIIIVKQNIHYSTAPRVNKLTKIDSTLVMKSNTSLRGAIYIKNIGFLNTAYSELISNPDKFQNWNSKGPEISFTEIEYVNNLNDVPLPYLIYKKENSDTIYIKKDIFNLYFKLVKQ